MSIIRAYSHVMAKHPFRTQCFTTATLIATGDIISQKLIEKQKNLNLKRTGKFALFGLVYIGPCISMWYRFLDRTFKFKAKSINLKPWQKVIVDQSLFNPTINFFAMPVLGILNQESFDKIKENIRQNYIDIMSASYKIWPAVQMINFYFIPLNYRVVFASTFSLVWNSYYTWKLGEK